jgi:pyrroloquinoline quinone (PQQ) biosynthesis protein C
METRNLVPPSDFIEELEGLRREHRKEFPFRQDARGKTKEEIAEARKKRHVGGSDNHKFEGEKYLNCPIKSVRRMQLRKLVDEGGVMTFGGKVPSHAMLDRLGTIEFGLTQEEILRLEKDDAPPDKLIVRGWWVNHCRTSHWAVAIGSGMVVEGEKKVNPKKELEELEEMRKEYEAMGIKNVAHALWFDAEHAGVDVDHANFNERVIKQYVSTPELQEEMRKAFILRLQNQGF